MDIFLITMGLGLMILGIIGSFLPVLPGPITSWFGFLSLYLSNSIEVSKKLLIITLIVATIIWTLDFLFQPLEPKNLADQNME